MTKAGGLLAIIGLGLLLASLIPWPVGASQAEVRPAAETTTISQVDLGQALFLAKGCATCHTHGALGDLGGKAAVGPNLTHYQPDPDFINRWLRDPAAVRPETQMPDLALSDEEIEVLIAFLNDAGKKPGDLAAGPESCPITHPSDPPFNPPEPVLSKEDVHLKASPLGSLEGYFWHGGESLWTQLRLDGIWAELPFSERGYTQKIFFSREGYNWREEPLPPLTVSGRRLDVPGVDFEELEATNGFHPGVGSFMLVGVDIPTAGCWKITGHYEGHELSFVVWVEPE